MADNLYAICEPRSDVLQGALKESDFAADLSQVLRGDAPDEYKKPRLFFANTYPTKGLRNALKLMNYRPQSAGWARFRGYAASASSWPHDFKVPSAQRSTTRATSSRRNALIEYVRDQVSCG